MTPQGGDLPRIELVLLMREPSDQEMLGPVVWAVFDEVERLFNLSEPLARFSRACVASDLTTRLAARVPADDVVSLNRYDWGEFWANCEGVYPDTIDQHRMADQLPGVLPESRGTADSVIVVTDQEMTPPQNWRYILWDEHEGVRVVSLAAMDPEYWGIKDRARRAVVKHRVRAACACTTGGALGLVRCNNEQCFMFGNVDSVTRLDVMRTIGREHEDFPVEDAVGYHVHTDDPASGQEIASGSELKLTGWPPP
jgi:hypothetical protein